MTPYARTVIREVAERRGVSPSDIVKTNRTQPVYRARMEVAKLLDARGYTSPRIGAMLNHDHTTILFYLGKLARKPKPPRPPKVKAAKPPAKKRWGKPRIAHLKCAGCYRCRRARPRLIRFAGFDPTDVQWVTRPHTPKQEHASS